MAKVDSAGEIVKLARLCFLAKLSRNVEEIDNHPEYYEWRKKNKLHFPLLLDMIMKGDLRNYCDFSKSIMPTFILLYLERSTNCPWNDEECFEFAKKFNRNFQIVYRITIENVFHYADFCDLQEVFDSLLKELNTKATSEDFKKYPALIKSYHFLVTNLKDYKVTYNPATVFPICLLLIEDYVTSHRMRGLRCCLALLTCMEEKHFEGGNYYDVIFSSLKKIWSEKKLEITKLVHNCLIQFIRVVPSHEKESKTDEIFSNMLEQIHMESNLHRKTACFGFIKEIIKLHKVNCVNKRLLKVVLLENIDICCNDAVADILLIDVLQTLQVWITHCWCVWKFSNDHKLLSTLIKLLYVSRKEKIATDIQEIIVSLISLCSKDEREQILINLHQSRITAPEFQEKLEIIKKEISV